MLSLGGEKSKHENCIVTHQDASFPPVVKFGDKRWVLVGILSF